MTRSNPRPQYSAQEAVARAISRVGTGTYRLGAGDALASSLVFDCFGFAVSYCYGLPRNRKGYNRGWLRDLNFPDGPSVVDDMNSNSAAEDAMHGKDVFDLVCGDPRVGDVLVYPTIPPIVGPDGISHGPWIGHAAIAVSVSRALGHWDPDDPDFALLDIVECVPRRPAIRHNTGAEFDGHSRTWPKPQHRARLLRVIA